MDIEVIPLSRLQSDAPGLLSEVCNSGRALVVEMPDHRMVAIQTLEPNDADDSLVNDLLANCPEFRALVEKSKAGTRKPFSLSG